MENIMPWVFVLGIVWFFGKLAMNPDTKIIGITWLVYLGLLFGAIAYGGIFSWLLFIGLGVGAVGVLFGIGNASSQDKGGGNCQ